MAFDGITTCALTNELSTLLTGGRIYKIAETERDELILTIKPMMEQGGGQVKLYLSADPTLPLCYLTTSNKTSPMNAPAFCMLLRKHLQNGRIIKISQPGLERIISMEVEHLNEMGDLCTHRLIIELMGKHSNIIFLTKEDVIVDSIKHISSMVSSVREVLPGRPYFIPNTTSKRNPLEETKEEFLKTFAEGAMPPASLLVKTYTGFSNICAEELIFRASIHTDRSAKDMEASEVEALWKVFTAFLAQIKSNEFKPNAYYAKENGAPCEYAAFPLSMYEDQMRSEDFPTMSLLLEHFYAQKNEVTRMRQKSADLRHVVQTILERDVHKYDLQCKQMKDTEKKDKYRIYGELLNTYGYSIADGSRSCELDNYYTGEKLTVPLDPQLSPLENAKKYFDRYTKLKRTASALSTLTEEVKAEITQLNSIKCALDMAQNEGDLEGIREELVQSGYVRHKSTDRKKAKGRTPASKPLHYVSSDGLDIYVGKNNLQNDELTFHVANGGDIWFHANDMPGSHVILKTNGLKFDEVPDRSFVEAASIAAYYSSGRDQEKVEIDYLERKNVKKPSGAKPGFVVYYTNYSLIAPTDISSIKQI